MNKILYAEYLGTFRIRLVFSDSQESIFDLAAYINAKKGSLLKALHDEQYAQRFFIDAGALCWPNGLELSPERLKTL
jgi:hypothetical protein